MTYCKGKAPPPLLQQPWAIGPRKRQYSPSLARPSLPLHPTAALRCHSLSRRSLPLFDVPSGANCRIPAVPFPVLMGGCVSCSGLPCACSRHHCAAPPPPPQKQALESAHLHSPRPRVQTRRRLGCGGGGAHSIKGNGFQKLVAHTARHAHPLSRPCPVQASPAPRPLGLTWASRAFTCGGGGGAIEPPAPPQKKRGGGFGKRAQLTDTIIANEKKLRSCLWQGLCISDSDGDSDSD